MTQSFSNAGVERLEFSLEDDNGLIIGFTLSPAADAVVGFQEMDGVTDFNFPQPSPQTVTTRGNNKALFTYNFKATEKAAGDITLGILDLDAFSKVQGHSHIDDGGFVYALINGDEAEIRSGWVMVTSHAQSADSGEFGNSGYYVAFYRVQFVPVGSGGRTFQGENQFSYSIVAKPFSVLPWGETLVLGTHEHTAADGVDGWAVDFLEVDRWLVDGVSTSFDLNYELLTTTTPKVVHRAADGTVTILTAGTAPLATGEYEATTTAGVTTIDLGDTFADGSVFVRYGRA